MGYDSRITGELSVTGGSSNETKTKEQQEVIDFALAKGLPAPSFEASDRLSQKAIRAIEAIDSARFFEVDEEGLVTSYDEGKAYDFDAELLEIIEIIKNDGCVANGIVYRIGEDQGDVERFIVVDNEVTTEKAELRWPDGTSAESEAAR